MNDIPYDSLQKTIDHITPLNKKCKGKHVKSNIRFICFKCNITRPKDGRDIVKVIYGKQNETRRTNFRNKRWIFLGKDKCMKLKELMKKKDEMSYQGLKEADDFVKVARELIKLAKEKTGEI